MLDVGKQFQTEAIAAEVEAIELETVRLGVDPASWEKLLGDDGTAANG